MHYFYTYNKLNSFYTSFREDDRNPISIVLLTFLMTDYERRSSENSNKYERILRGLVEQKRKKEYWGLNILGSSFLLSFYLVFHFSYWGLVIPVFILALIMMASRYIIKTKWGRHGLYLAFSYSIRAIIAFLIGNILYSLFTSETIVQVSITQETSWLMNLGTVAFSFAIGLFFVISLTSLLNRSKAIIKEVRENISSILIRNEYMKTRDLYHEKEFIALSEKYSQAKTSPNCINWLGVLIMICVTIGWGFYSLASNTENAGSIDAFITITDVDLLNILVIAILIGCLLIFLLIQNEVLHISEE